MSYSAVLYYCITTLSVRHQQPSHRRGKKLYCRRHRCRRRSQVHSSLKPMCCHLILLTFVPRYGAVVRGANAYVPPGARKQGVNTGPVVTEIPKVSVNGPDGATLPSQTQSPSSSKTPSPAPTTIKVIRPIPPHRPHKCAIDSLLRTPSCLRSENLSRARSSASRKKGRPWRRVTWRNAWPSSSSLVKVSRSVRATRFK